MRIAGVFFLSISLILVMAGLVSAANVEVDKLSTHETLIDGFGKPAVFGLNVTNLGDSDAFGFYNLVGFLISPGEVLIEGGETKKVQLETTPISTIDHRGFYTITYYIKRTSDGSQMQEKLTFKIIDLGDAIEISSEDIDLEKDSVEVSVKNVEDIDLGETSLDLSSPFFEINEEFSLGPMETKNILVELDKEDFKDLTAGFYTMVADVSAGDLIDEVEGTVRFIEKDIVTTTGSELGFIVNTQIIEKKNEGNLVRHTETVVEKNIISRLFTSFSPEPDMVERQGSKIYYTWVRDVSPGQTLQIHVKTNWLFPFLIILLIVVIVVLSKQYSKRDLVLRKRVSFVKTKGGEFALKVSVFANAKNHIERVNVIDRLPLLVDIYEKFGAEEPSKIDKKNKRIEWNFENLEAGETRVLSYVIYSKVGVFGKFALPTATAIYEKEGEIHESESNRTFFVAEPHPKKKDDEEFD